MALLGTAFLALWNDIARHREAEYDAWHTREHVPERVSVDGFFGARRYVNRTRTTHRYFTLYDVASLSVFASAQYRDLVENPTPWSASMRPDFHNFERASCEVVSSSGQGLGAVIAVLGFNNVSLANTNEIFPRLLELPGVVGCHLGAGQAGPSAAPWSTPVAAQAPSRPFDRIALVEALDTSAALNAHADLKGALGLADMPTDFASDIYNLTFVFPGPDSSERVGHRRAHWDQRSTS